MKAAICPLGMYDCCNAVGAKNREKQTNTTTRRNNYNIHINVSYLILQTVDTAV